MPMKAWQYIDARGGLENSLRLTDHVENPPPPKPGQALIEVLAMALNPADYKLPESWPFLSKLAFGRPIVPGLDLCGRVSQLPATGIEDLKKGQLVFGRIDRPSTFGPLAQYALAPVSGVVPLPSGVAIDQAAGIGTCAITAYQSIVPFAKEGDRIFINGGSGGTGIFAIQIAKLLGCHVVVSCSDANAQLCEDLGADEIIDYKSVDVLQDLASRGKVFNLAVDFVGKLYQLHQESVKFLRPEGVFVAVAASDDSWSGIGSMVKSWLLPSWLGGVNRRWTLMLAKNNREHLTSIAKWVGEGKLKTIIDSKHAFEDAPKAFERLKTGRARGKVVVYVSELVEE